jgi:AAA+ superfamily predicted ATPase
VIAATNFEQVLDPAIWRRFDEIVRFERPGSAELTTLIRKRLAALQFTDWQIDQLGRHLAGTSYADAERVCLDIRKRSVLRGNRQIHEEDLVEALARHRYRQSVLLKATPPANPSVDRE